MVEKQSQLGFLTPLLLAAVVVELCSQAQTPRMMVSERALEEVF
jgi:hypothetical protein